MLAGCLMWPLLVCVAALLIVSRSHYTIDIVIGYWLAIGLFIIYHMYCDVKVRHCERTDANLLFLTLVFEVSLRFCWCNSFFSVLIYVSLDSCVKLSRFLSGNA
jgi:hypothetical protein